MMNQEIKAKWLEALRSGKYAQTQSDLKNSNGYCCLGVLCEVLGAEWRVNDCGEHIPYSAAGVCLAAILPNYGYLSIEALAMVGMSMVRQEQLALMNDEGTRFADIATSIEVND